MTVDPEMAGHGRGKRKSVGAVALLGIATLAGCVPHVFPRELFTISAEGVDYPVMLSETPTARPGRKIEASSGTQASVRTVGNSQSSVTFSQASQSELPVSVKLHAQVLRADKWIQLDGAEFYSMDFSGWGVGAAARKLTLRGTVQR